MGRELVVFPSSTEEMIQLGERVGRKLCPNTILALSGDLGSGKTTFVQGLAKGLNIDAHIQSPTFVFFNQYKGTYPLFHFDLYRMKGEEDFLGLGFEEYFMAGGITVLEWPERITSLLTTQAWQICFSHHAKGRKVAFPLEMC